MGKIRINLPTKITIARLALIPLIVVAYCLQSLAGWVCAVTGVLFWIAGWTDFFDGYIARKYNMVTDLGKFLDPIADKILVIVGLAFVVDGQYFAAIGIPYVAVICSIIIVAREFIIGLLRQIAALKNFVIAADKMGKLKTVATLTALTTLLFSPLHVVITWIGFVELIIATVLTVVSGVHYVYKNRGVFEEEDKPQGEACDNAESGAEGNAENCAENNKEDNAAATAEGAEIAQSADKEGK